MKIEKPVLGRPFLGPAKIEDLYVAEHINIQYWLFFWYWGLCFHLPNSGILSSCDTTIYHMTERNTNKLCVLRRWSINGNFYGNLMGIFIENFDDGFNGMALWQFWLSLVYFWHSERSTFNLCGFFKSFFNSVWLNFPYNFTSLLVSFLFFEENGKKKLPLLSLLDW